MEAHGTGDMIRQLLAADKSLVTYRPALRKLGGSIAGTVLLQQIIYWDEKMGGKFFKFSEPPTPNKDGKTHSLYKPGDSWEEELGMSAKELRTALKHFAFKCGSKNRAIFGDEYEAKRKSSLVIYYTDSQRATWYVLNREFLSKLLWGIYKESDQREFTYTETTTETTTNITNDDFSSNTIKASVSLKGKVPPDFERCWEMYGKKTGRPAALRYWSRLSAKAKKEIEGAIPAYVASTPDKKFRKNFSGWINPANEMWKDEVLGVVSPSEDISLV